MKDACDHPRSVIMMMVMTTSPTISSHKQRFDTTASSDSGSERLHKPPHWCNDYSLL